MDGETAHAEQETLVFAVDQLPFTTQKGYNRVQRFCVLRPLMTLAGERLAPDPESFPNGGRVWWMLRDDIRTEMVVPGSIWSGPIDMSSNWDPHFPKGHRYQANVRGIQQGGPELVELLQVNEDDPDLAWVQGPRPLPWPRPTPSIVFLLGRKSMLGPLRGSWKPEERQLHLTAHLAARPEVLRVPLEAFLRIARTESFRGTVNEFDDHADSRPPFAVTLSKLSWLNLEQLRQAGEVFDASTDAQILKWAAEQHGFTRAQTSSLRDLLGALTRNQSASAENGVARKRERLTQIVTGTNRLLDLNEEIAGLLGSTPTLAEHLDRHAEKLVERQVEEKVKQRAREIEEKTRMYERGRDEVKSKLDMLSAEYDRKAAAAEEELRKKAAARIKEIDEREKAVAAREDQQTNLVERLERVMERYVREADRFGEDLLAQVPILRKLGLGGTLSNDVAATPAAQPLPLPAFLDTPRIAPGAAPVTEADFVAQLAHVVEQHDFFFNSEELINFHVCVKTGGLTILAGISGTGKSSLPRLYAEALGCKEEYLHIPVRPDWLDDRDLIGAYNALARRFEPANSGLVDHLIAAALDRQRARGGIFLICLDEMNLARVEHYFAQFLSKLELSSDQRFLELFASGLVQAADPYHPHQRLHLGDNLRFLGTVNIDETTHFFSPKVLDRAQVVVFGAPDLAARRRGARGAAAHAVHGIKPIPLNTYQTWCRRLPEDSPGRSFLLTLNAILKPSRLGLGFRQLDRMLDYVGSALPFFTEDQALDYQLLQVILPRLRPTAPAFGETLQALVKTVRADRFPRAADYLARFEARTEDDFFQLL